MRGYGRLFVPVILYFICCFFLAFKDETLWLYFVMIWNVFLASLPLVFAVKAKKYTGSGRKVQAVVLLILWLLFYPNSIYVATDMIHIAGGEFYTASGSIYERGIYSTDILLWAKLIVISAGIVISMLMGLESMRIIYNLIIERANMITALISIVIVSFLGGLGVFIGRFLRFNSWDVLMPVSLIKNIIAAIDSFALKFSLMYGCFALLAFFCYYLVVDTVDKNNIRQSS